MTDENLNQNDKNSKELNNENTNQKPGGTSKKKPIRFIFGHDTTEEDVDRFIDSILGPDPKKKVEEINEDESLD
jgi:selenocysteine lyase/cysteine desulfurase